MTLDEKLPDVTSSTHESKDNASEPALWETKEYQDHWGVPDASNPHYTGNPWNPYNASPTDWFNCSNDIWKP